MAAAVKMLIAAGVLKAGTGDTSSSRPHTATRHSTPRNTNTATEHAPPLNTNTATEHVTWPHTATEHATPLNTNTATEHVTSPAPGATSGKDNEKIIQLWEAQGSGVLALPKDTPLDIATANSLITARGEQNQREFLKAMGQGLQSISDDTLKQFKDKHYLLAIKQQWKEDRAS